MSGTAGAFLVKHKVVFAVVGALLLALLLALVLGLAVAGSMGKLEPPVLAATAPNSKDQTLPTLASTFTLSHIRDTAGADDTASVGAIGAYARLQDVAAYGGTAVDGETLVAVWKHNLYYVTYSRVTDTGKYVLRILRGLVDVHTVFLTDAMDAAANVPVGNSGNWTAQTTAAVRDIAFLESPSTITMLRRRLLALPVTPGTKSRAIVRPSQADYLGQVPAPTTMAALRRRLLALPATPPPVPQTLVPRPRPQNTTSAPRRRPR
jgi:hypothetical protein